MEKARSWSLCPAPKGLNLCPLPSRGGAHWEALQLILIKTKLMLRLLN